MGAPAADGSKHAARDAAAAADSADLDAAPRSSPTRCAARLGRRAFCAVRDATSNVSSCGAGRARAGVPASSSPSQSALRASGFTLGLLKACFLLLDVARRPFTGDSGDRGVEPAPTWAAMSAYSIAASSGAATSIVNGDFGIVGQAAP